MCIKVQSVSCIPTTRMVRSAEELFAIDKMAAQGKSIKKVAETLGGASGNDEAVAAAAALRGRDGAAQRWATSRRGRWFVSRYLVFSDMCVMCTFFNWSSDKIRSVFVRITDQRIALQSYRAAQSLSVRRRLQASGIERGRSIVQGAHECGALARESRSCVGKNG